MTDKPMKNGRKYVDSGFVHDMMDISTSSRVAVDENGATAQFYCCDFCEQWCCSLCLLRTFPARASSLGRCSHVVTFHFNEIAFLQIQIKHYILLCFHLLST